MRALIGSYMFADSFSDPTRLKNGGGLAIHFQGGFNLRKMTDVIPWAVVIPFSLFSGFIFYQQLHLKNFRGDNRSYRMFLSISFLLGNVTGIVFLVYYGLQFDWMKPLILFGISFGFKIIVILIDVLLSARQTSEHFVLSKLAFIGWPTCAFLMFSSIPEIIG